MTVDFEGTYQQACCLYSELRWVEWPMGAVFCGFPERLARVLVKELPKGHEFHGACPESIREELSNRGVPKYVTDRWEDYGLPDYVSQDVDGLALILDKMLSRVWPALEAYRASLTKEFGEFLLTAKAYGRAATTWEWYGERRATAHELLALIAGVVGYLPILPRINNGALADKDAWLGMAKNHGLLVVLLPHLHGAFDPVSGPMPYHMMARASLPGYYLTLASVLRNLFAPVKLQELRLGLDEEQAASVVWKAELDARQARTEIASAVSSIRAGDTPPEEDLAKVATQGKGKRNAECQPRGLAKEMGIADWSELDMQFDADGLMVKKLGAPGPPRKLTWAKLGIQGGRSQRDVLLELAKCPYEAIANPQTSAHRSAVHRLNKNLCYVFGIQGHPVLNDGKGGTTRALFKIMLAHTKRRD